MLKESISELETQFVEKLGSILSIMPQEILDQLPEFDRIGYTSFKSCFSRIKAKKRQLKSQTIILDSSDKGTSLSTANGSNNSDKHWSIFNKQSKALGVRNTPKVTATSTNAIVKFQPENSKLALMKEDYVNESKSYQKLVRSSDETFSTYHDGAGPSTSTSVQSSEQPIFQPQQNIVKQKTAEFPLSRVASGFNDLDLSEFYF